MNSLQREVANLTSHPDLFDGDLQSGFDVFNTTEKIAIPGDITIRSDRRLGHRAEDILTIWLEHNPRYSLLARNLQLFDNKQTVGELDFILYDKVQNEVLHVELVCKFYVYIPELHTDSSSVQAWWGPKFQDSLELKLQKLRKKQFPLLHTSLAQQTLIPLMQEHKVIGLPVKQQLCFKAFLFVPNDTCLAPLDVPSDCVVGTYMTETEFSQHTFAEVLEVPKLSWLEQIR